ncbi:hypothetical protein J2129_002453 [Methanofollis sp. W23]|nr:hypothetical protein [Methanofollis sp. W23]
MIRAADQIDLPSPINRTGGAVLPDPLERDEAGKAEWTTMKSGL